MVFGLSPSLSLSFSLAPARKPLTPTELPNNLTSYSLSLSLSLSFIPSRGLPSKYIGATNNSVNGLAMLRSYEYLPIELRLPFNLVFLSNYGRQFLLGTSPVRHHYTWSNYHMMWKRRGIAVG